MKNKIYYTIHFQRKYCMWASSWSPATALNTPEFNVINKKYYTEEDANAVCRFLESKFLDYTFKWDSRME